MIGVEFAAFMACIFDSVWRIASIPFGWFPVFWRSKIKMSFSLLKSRKGGNDLFSVGWMTLNNAMW